MKPSFPLLVLGAGAVLQCAAKPQFVKRIPNGDKVDGVAALGHVDPDGGGERNAFGLAFDDAGFAWTKELCQMDSDGDGQTNGQELGDPCCEWVEGSNENVSWSSGVSAPGDAKSKSDPSLWESVKCSTGTEGGAETATGSAGSGGGGYWCLASSEWQWLDSGQTSAEDHEQWVPASLDWHPIHFPMYHITNAMKFLAIVATAAFVGQAAAKPTFLPLIPGSKDVKGVDAIGHKDPSDGGARNAFGSAFDKAGQS
ncbi:hypothetical protein Poli38472_002889 [Pythium oligandrum]|uniref:Temptin Cys/Cys disulfide domain-containing protein n=1 Tax=Pythium oligandrum TaxID=41045 RepID=A0A8K1C5J6_PYTOL|nr:hypothetical protein Poli38472_002889 [Pythium oligandrum]|eukprot:TMW56964.1 hypothetical protein Poli38472_002889 [Pythium oligandrum]